MLSDRLREIIVCPACLHPGLLDAPREDPDGAVRCAGCERRYPRGPFGVVDLQVLDQIVSLPEPYLGLWALTQNASIDEYRRRDPASVSTPERMEVKAFKEYIGSHEGLVLDIGSGTDYTPGYWPATDTCEILALDPLPVETEIPFAKLQAWNELLPFRDESIDAVIYATSLDHLLCLESALAETCRVLRDGGDIYLWCALSLDPSQFAHIPAAPLFSRPLAPLPLEEGEDVRVLDARNRETVRNIFAEKDALHLRYASLLQDKYHFRHIPLAYLGQLVHANPLSLRDISVWKVQGTTFLYVFVHATRCARDGADKVDASRHAGSVDLIRMQLELQEIRNEIAHLAEAMPTEHTYRMIENLYRENFGIGRIARVAWDHWRNRGKTKPDQGS